MGRIPPPPPPRRAPALSPAQERIVAHAANCRNCGAPPLAGAAACRFCGTPNGASLFVGGVRAGSLVDVLLSTPTPGRMESV